LKRILCAGLVLLLVSCGLDTYIYFYPINQVINWPSDTDESLNYFSFRTRDAMNTSNVYFRGFEIMYRIYNNASERAADVSAISSYNSSNPTLAYSYISATKNYVRMNASTRVDGYPLISNASADRTVVVRFSPYGNIPASFTVDGIGYGTALRTLDGATKVDDKSYAFTFSSIQSNNSDVKFGSWTDTSDKKWFVQAFVLAYGYDETFKPIYSEAFNIGYLTIRP
jgi:hypothetical protein